jgi:hypothetical protein
MPPDEVLALYVLHLSLLLVVVIYIVILVLIMKRTKLDKGFWGGVLGCSAAIAMMLPIAFMPKGTWGRLMLHAAAGFGIAVTSLVVGIPSCISDKKDGQSKRTLAILGIILNLLVLPLNIASMHAFADISGFYLEP